MATIVETKTVCDTPGCGRAENVEQVKITLGGRSSTTDLCPEHLTPVKGAWGLGKRSRGGRPRKAKTVVDLDNN